MRRLILQMSLTVALVFAGILAITPLSLADKPSGGGKKAEKHNQKEMGEKREGKESRDQGASSDGSRHGAKGNEYFGE